MEYQTLNGQILEAETPRDLAEQLWQMMMIPEPTIEEWMRNSARRAKDWNGAAVRTTTPEEHVEDLIKAGIVKQVE